MNNKISTLAMATMVVLAGCKSPATHEAHDDKDTTGHRAVLQAWHCPMHPQIVRDHPGTCPICGMDLVPITAGGASSHADHEGMTDSVMPAGADVHVESSVIQKIGVRTAMVEAGVVGREIRADAEGILDEAAEVSITVRAMGYLESTTSLRTGDHLRRGAVLATFYSPEMVAAQGDWLASRSRGDSLGAQAAKERLESLGFPRQSFLDAIRTKSPVHAIPLSSPVSGWLRSRTATTGQSVMAGSELFRLVEGSGSVLEAHLPMADASSLKVGDVAMVSGEGIEKPVSSRIISVVAQLDRASRSATLRLAAPKGAQIRVGALYQIAVQSKAETGFVVPQDAVLHSGKRDVVFLDLGDGLYRPVMVELGPTSNGMTLVRSGIEAGDEVVVSAQFLLDGESRLQTALDQLDAGAEGASGSGHGGM